MHNRRFLFSPILLGWAVLQQKYFADESVALGSARNLSAAFALSLMPPNADRALSIYMRERASCIWLSKNLTNAFFQHGTPFDMVDYTPSSVSLRECNINVSDSTIWHIERIGPFQTQDSFPSVFFRYPVEVPRAVSQQGAFLTAHFLSPVESNGNPISYPPVYVHHAHYNSRYETGNAGLIAQVHGDSHCHTNRGVACFMQEFPLGYGILIIGDGRYDAVYQDLRTAEAETTIYGELALRFTKQRLTRIIPLFLYNPWDPQAYYKFLLTSPKLGCEKFNSCSIMLHNRSQTGLHWYSVRLPVSGQLVWNYFHSHAYWVDDMLLFGATPLQLGLQEVANLSQPFVPKYMRQEELTNVKMRIFHNLAISRSVCDVERCPFTPALWCREADDSDRWEWIDRFPYQRFAPARCQSGIRFVAGQPITLVSFLKPAFPNLDINSGIEPMHLFSRNLLIPDDQLLPEAGSYCTFKATSYEPFCV